MINKIIEDCIRLGIPVKCEYILDRGFVYEIDGFYKSGNISIEEIDGKLIATARYDEKTEITEPRDIVILNLEWYNYSKDRFEGWSTPSDFWINLYNKFNIKY